MDFFRRLVFVPMLLAGPLFLRAQSTLPTLTQALPAQALVSGGVAATVDLRNYFSLPGVTGQVARFDTVLGKFDVELFAADAPANVANFLSYVAGEAYTNTIVHRSVPGFVIQGGGYRAVSSLDSIPRPTTAPLEYKVANTRGTIAMARTDDPNSASSEWFVNLVDNTATLGPGGSSVQGYTAFGRVLGTGMTVVDAIAALPRGNLGANTPFTTIPLVNFNGTSASVDNLVVVSSVTVVPVYPADNSGAAVLNFAAANNNPDVVTATLAGSTLTLTPVGVGTATISLRAGDVNGNFTSSTLAVTVAAASSAPVITSQPRSLTVAADSTVVFEVTATGNPAPTYQWFRGSTAPGAGTPALISGATAPTLVLRGTTGANAALAGTYSVVVTNSEGAVTSTAATLTLITASDPGRLINLSILTPLAAGESMTMGAVLGGDGTGGTKPLLARAAGPSLAPLGVSGYLPDPAMTLNNTSVSPTVVIDSNNDWSGTAALTAAFNSVGAFPFVNASSKDAAIFRPDLAPGNFTVQVRDFGGAGGTVIAELYDATPAGAFTSATPRLVNVSVLKQIETGATLTVGFVVGGSTAKTVLIRAIGPGLAPLGVGGVMADPTMTLSNISASPAVTVATNNNWGGASAISETASRVGAFAVNDPAGKDAMLLVTLAPGNYTAQVNAVGAGGTAIVEVYEVP